MAVTIDIGDATDVHPKNKQDVGDRLALWALHNEYGQINLVVSGPLYESIEVEDENLRIHFSSVGGGLVTAVKNGKDPAIPTSEVKLKHFVIAREDRNWFPANAI